MQPGRVLLTVSREQVPEPETGLLLYTAVPRKAKFDTLLKQAAELGVREIRLLLCERSVAAPEGSDRWETLLQEGCKQSGNPFLPKIAPPVKLAAALAEFSGTGYFGAVENPGAEAPRARRRKRRMVRRPGRGLHRRRGGGDGARKYPCAEPRSLCAPAGNRRRLRAGGTPPDDHGGGPMKYGLLFAILLLFATGCGQSDPARHPMMLKGDQYRKEGNFELAEKFYLKFVEQRPDSALGHRTLATLYDESLADPAAALYHYNMFLRLDPHSPDRELIDGYRRLARPSCCAP